MSTDLPAGLVVAPLSEVPFARLRPLLESSLGSAAVDRSEAFWRWKHEANPFGASPGLVALADDRPVALRVFLRWQWRSGGELVPAVRAVDTATHTDWQRRGLFRHLTLGLASRMQEEGVSFVFNTPNPTSRAGYLAMGWHDVGRLPLLVRPLRPWRMLTSRLPARLRHAAAAEEPPGPAGFGSLDELLADPALEGFLAAWGRDETRLHTPRDTRYLRWRYAAGPGLRYAAMWRFVSAAGAVSGAAAVVRLRRRQGLVEAILSELLASDDSEGRGAAAELLARLVAAADLDYVAAMASPGTPERRLLARYGFLPLPARRRWTVRGLAAPLATLPGALDEGRTWRISAGDLELF